MGKTVFVPLSDEMIYEHPELITGPIGAFAPQRVDFPDPGQAGEKGVHCLRKKQQQDSQIGRTMGRVSNLDSALFESQNELPLKAAKEGKAR